MTHEFAVLLARVALVAAIALGIVLILRVPARRWLGATFAYRLWLLVPVALLAAFLPGPVHPLIPASQIAPSMLLPTTTIKASAIVIESTPIGWPIILLASWIVGALSLLAILVRQQRRYLRHLGILRADDVGMLRAEATEGCPALVGALRPRIVLPSDFELRYSERERELVLAHERAHLARGDAQINAAAALLCCLNWFNPLFHFAVSRFRFDQEIACDAVVMSRFPEARRYYADAMLKAQRVGESRQELRLPAGCHWLQSHPLKERIAMLKFPKPTALQRALAGAVLLSMTLLAGYTSWAAQPGRPPEAAVGAAQQGGKRTGAAYVQTDFAITIDGVVVGGSGSQSVGESLPPDKRWVVAYDTTRDGVAKISQEPDSINMFARFGDTFTMSANRGNERWKVDGTAKDLDDGTIEFNATIWHNGVVVSRPSLVVVDGRQAAMQVDESPSTSSPSMGVPAVASDAIKVDQSSARGFKLDLTLRKVTDEALHDNSRGALLKTGPAVGSQPVVIDEKSTVANKPAPSIQLGEIQDVAPSENISYRKMSPPKYPHDAVKAGIGARVILKVLVDTNGNAKSIDAEKIELVGEPKPSADGSTPNKEAFKEIFFQAASSAVKSWRFNSGYKDGQPFEGYALVPIDFMLFDCGGTKDDPCPGPVKPAQAASAKQGGHA